MFGIVALCCLYLGIKNVKSAFSLAPFSRWQFINWALFLTGVLMLLLIIPCLMQANKDLKKAQKEKDDKEKAETRKTVLPPPTKKTTIDFTKFYTSKPPISVNNTGKGGTFYAKKQIQKS